MRVLRTDEKIKLSIELVPTTSHYKNVRSKVTDEVWNKIRTKCYENADHKCEVCGDTGLNQGRKHKVECHEVWEFCNDTRTQTLKDFISLCPKCHSVKHIGLAAVENRLYPALDHLMKINNFNLQQAEEYVMDAFATCQARSRDTWKVDTTYAELYI